MSDLIDRQAAIDAVMNMMDIHRNEPPFHGQLFHWTCVKALLVDQEAVDAIEVVRCEDCKYKYGSICTRFAEVYVKDDDFCSRAERKDDGTD